MDKRVEEGRKRREGRRETIRIKRKEKLEERGKENRKERWMIGRKERMKSYGSKMYQEIFIYIYHRCSQKSKKQTHFFFL